MSLKEKLVLATVIFFMLLGIAFSVVEENQKVETNDNFKQNITQIKEAYYTQIVDINEADAKILQTLDGVGEKKSISIVEYRDKNGMFREIEDLMHVGGIGEAIFEKNRDRLTVGNVTSEVNQNEIQDPERKIEIKETDCKKNEKINVNSCAEKDLLELPGIGEVKAAEIVRYRNTNGDFNKLEDLIKVKGIGEKTLQKIKDFITF